MAKTVLRGWKGYGHGLAEASAIVRRIRASGEVTFYQDFAVTFGPDVTRKWVARAGAYSRVEAPDGAPERLLFALMEAINFGSWPPWPPDEAGAKKIMTEHGDECRHMSVTYPTYLGMLMGMFDFFVRPTQGRR